MGLSMLGARNPSTLAQRSKFSWIGLVCILFIAAFYSEMRHRTPPDTVSIHQNSEILTPRTQAGNATLGFHKILALSAGPSWRTRGLKAAAEIAGIEIETPQQPFISEEMVGAYQGLGAQDDDKEKTGHGSAKAWLAHLDLIKFAFASRLNSVFIIEDDVDWDVTIRDQMMLLSDNVRLFLGSQISDTYPYGSTWDVLWVGHCGEVTEPDTVKLEYRDESLIPRDLYAGWSKPGLYDIKDGFRAVQKTKQTICTFGYGLSRQGLVNVLHVLGRGHDEAFDVAMTNACRRGDLRCLSVNPELMHHYNPKDGTGYVSPNMEANTGVHSSDESSFEGLKGTTANMKNSARCAALFQDSCLQAPSKIGDD